MNRLNAFRTFLSFVFITLSVNLYGQQTFTNPLLPDGADRIF